MDTWKITYANTTQEVCGDWDTIQATINALIQEHGEGHVPRVTKVTQSSDDVMVSAPLPSKEPEATKAAVQPAVLRDAKSGQEISLGGAARSQIDHDAAVAAGFAPSQPYFTRGTKVVDLGVENARISRLQHDEKPRVHEYVDEFVERIRAEERSDALEEATSLRMRHDGALVVIHNDKILRSLMVNERSFASLCNRLGIGGAQYLTKCWPALRATNINSWMEHDSCEEDKRIEQDSAVKRKQLVLRTRKPDAKVALLPGTTREAYGVVSPRYTPFDVDRIAQALKEATPKDARGTVTYDGTKARFEVMFHSDIKPERYVAGEFFKAGVIIRTDDTGGGSITGDTVIWQNLCLNLLCIDRPSIPLFGTARSPGIRHIGDYDQLVANFRAGFKDALSRLDHFLVAWGYAQEEDIIQRAKVAQPQEAGELGAISMEQAIPGFFRGIIERELVPVRGPVEEVTKDLLKAYYADTSAAPEGSRARIINAFTRYAHEQPQVNEWVQDDIQKAAGALLYGRSQVQGPTSLPAALPYVPRSER